MRILHTEWSDGLGGQEKRILAEVAGLAERGHYTAIACRGHARIKEEALKLGIDVHTLPLRRPYDISSIMKLAGILKAEKFDIVNTHSGVDAWIGGLAASFSRTPVLARTRHLNIPLKRSPLNFIHYLPDVYITCGENMRDTLVERCGFPEDKVISIPTGVSPGFFDIERNKKACLAYGIDEHSPVVANVGILRSVKGHEVTLKSVHKVAESVPGVKFLIVGDGPRKRELERMAGEMDIAGHVVFTGFVEDIPEIYSFTDVAVLSSWSEGLPQSMLQAMAAGVPVVATKVGGVPEIVIHGKTGELVEQGDHEALGKGIIHILKNPDYAMQIAERARDNVMKEHAAGRMIEKIESLYKDLLDRCNG
jgi:glycosyltransferase involved in cell wall biosynthesis